MKEWPEFLLITAVFPGCYYLPMENTRFSNAIFEVPSLTNSGMIFGAVVE